MLEQRLLAAASRSKLSFSKLSRLQAEEHMGPQGAIVWKEIGRYYDLDPNITEVDLSSIQARVEQKHERHKDTLGRYVQEIASTTVSEPNLLEDFITLKRRSLGLEISSRLLSGDDTGVGVLMEEHLNLTVPEIDEEEDCSPRVYNLYHVDDCLPQAGGGIKLYPSELDNVLGSGLQRGHHIVLFARYEIGKTAFAVTFAYGFCQQGLKVLFCGNEDPKESMAERFLSRFTGMCRDDMYSVPSGEVMQIAIDRHYGNLYFAPLSPGSPKEIQELITDYGPFDVLIVDQIRNLIGAGGDSRTLQLEAVANAIRFIGKRNNMLTISLTQAGDSAEGKLVLGRSDIDSSKTGIPGSCDVLIGVGCNDEYYKMEKRMVTFLKNKLTGDHNSCIVSIHKAISRVGED